MRKLCTQIEKHFHEFLQEEGENAFKQVNEFFLKERDLFYKQKIDELMQKGEDYSQSILKVRQSWVSVSGRSLEGIIRLLVEDFCKKNNLKMVSDRELKGNLLSEEYDLLKRSILVHLGEYSVLPDGDIILYKIREGIPKVLAILSVKNSFRERYTETPYWKIKLSQNPSTENIKVFMITPNKDDEISSTKNMKKARIVLEYELDGIYVAKSEYDHSKKLKGIDNLVTDLELFL